MVGGERDACDDGGITMDVAPLADDELVGLAIFPLEGGVLFPGSTLPLHVFEPRYRQLVQHCLAKRSPLAVWQVDSKLPRTAFGPALRPIATAGRIVAHVKLRDGRYNIIVQGLERIALVEEVPSDDLYRMVRARRLPLPAVDEGLIRPHLAVLRDLVRAMAVFSPQESQLLEDIIADQCCPEELSDVLCAALDEPASERQRMLELDDAVARIRHVADRLALMLMRNTPPTGEHPTADRH